MSLSFVFYSDTLVQGILYGGYVCFSSQRRIWTTSSLSLLMAVRYKINKAQNIGEAVSPTQLTILY